MNTISTNNPGTDPDNHPSNLEDDQIVLRMRGIGHSFALRSSGQNSDRSVLPILSGVDLDLQKGSVAVVLGPSGSGKSTLLNIASGIITPTSGTVRALGTELTLLDAESRGAFRLRESGFVFQNYRLMPALTATENVSLPLELLGELPVSECQRRAVEILRTLGLSDRLNSYPNQLSGGEQQRVAVARAYVHSPKIVYADEPTGSLDRDTAKLVVESLVALANERRCAVLVVTHDEETAARANQVYLLKGRHLVLRLPHGDLR